ncbi:MAG: ACT domain-containing protein, partial [Bacteroidetes bacterium]|nr:ACT domain-containing protein [Bacteroidota bacterium]
FGALKDVGVSVILISQASSEHSICFAIPSKQVKQAEQAAREVFFSEIHHGRTHDIQVVSNCSILAAVGDNMAETPGVAAKFFSALGRSGVNIRAIAQGSSERNISVVIDSEETTKALRAVHAAFYLSNFTVSIGLIGPGVIGKTFIQQVYQEKEKIKRQLKIDFRIRGIANSRKMLLEMKELDLKNWEQSFQDK